MTEDRRRGTGGPVRGERRRGDRRQGQGASLQFRRATDRRMSDGQYSALLGRRALERQAGSAPDPQAHVPEQREPAADPAASQVPVTGRCPECGEPCDPLWLVRHWVAAHPSWP